MRNSLTRLRVFLEGLTFGSLEMTHWSRFRIVDLSIVSPGDPFNRGPRDPSTADSPPSSMPSLLTRSPSSPKKRVKAATSTPGPRSFPVGHATQTSTPAIRCFLMNGIALGKILYRREFEWADAAAGRDISRTF